MFIHSSIDGHLGCFPLLAIVNSASMNMGVLFVWVPVFNSLGYIPRMELWGHLVILRLTFWGTPKLFHSSWTILHSHQQCIRFFKLFWPRRTMRNIFYIATQHSHVRMYLYNICIYHTYLYIIHIYIKTEVLWNRAHPYYYMMHSDVSFLFYFNRKIGWFWSTKLVPQLKAKWNLSC